jgi:hypothetical protein
VLRVNLDVLESELAYWEWVEDGEAYREWLIPAEIANQRGVVTLLGDDELPCPPAQAHRKSLVILSR